MSLNYNINNVFYTHICKLFFEVNQTPFLICTMHGTKCQTPSVK